MTDDFSVQSCCNTATRHGNSYLLPSVAAETELIPKVMDFTCLDTDVLLKKQRHINGKSIQVLGQTALHSQPDQAMSGH